MHTYSQKILYCTSHECSPLLFVLFLRALLTNIFSPLTSLLAARATLARPLDSLSTAPRSSEFDAAASVSRSRAAHLMHGPRARPLSRPGAPAHCHTV